MRKVSNRQKQGGFIISMELIFIATILVIGLIAGWNAVRTAVVQELADVGSAVSSVSQEYFWNGVTGHEAETVGSGWLDLQDECDEAPLGVGQAGANSRCIVVDTPPTPETPQP